MDTIRVLITEGEGYWDLRYPWGGPFHRLTIDIVAPIDKVFTYYNNGDIKEFQVTINDMPCGFKFNSRSMVLQ